MSIIAVLEARRRIAPHVRHTPFVRSAWLSRASGADVWLKLESQQRSNAFKVRGAFNAALRLAEAGDRPTLVTASAGNHGRALADAAAVTGMACVVFTPADAPRAKLDAIEAAGARLDASFRDYDAAEVAAKDYAASTGGCYISPYSHPDVIAGGGTVALEMLQDQPRLDVVVVPMGGGGLISGMGVTLSQLAPGCRLVGVEAEASCAFGTARRHGRITEIDPQPTIADGLGGNLEPGAVTFDYVQRHVGEIVAVDEASIVAAVGDLAGQDHQIAEGAAAVGPAALASGRVPNVTGRTVGIVLTGANIDRARLARCLA
ncbi:MAG: pyridoxal-phosphate dependent enzyme [Vicinamibacteraceae bacterium]